VLNFAIVYSNRCPYVFCPTHRSRPSDHASLRDSTNSIALMTAHNSDSPNLQKEAAVSLNSLPSSDDPLFVFRPFGALTLRFVDCAMLFERLPVSADDEAGGPVNAPGPPFSILMKGINFWKRKPDFASPQSDHSSRRWIPGLRRDTRSASQRQNPRIADRFADRVMIDRSGATAGNRHS
jgi:hypothetical protein